MTTQTERDALRAKIAADVEAYLETGRAIKVYGPTRSRDDEMWHEGEAERRAAAARAGRAASRACTQRTRRR